MTAIHDYKQYYACWQNATWARPAKKGPFSRVYALAECKKQKKHGRTVWLEDEVGAKEIYIGQKS